MYVCYYSCSISRGICSAQTWQNASPPCESGRLQPCHTIYAEAQALALLFLPGLCMHRGLPVHLKAWPLPGWYHLPDKFEGVSCPEASSFQSLSRSIPSCQADLAAFNTLFAQRKFICLAQSTRQWLINSQKVLRWFVLGFFENYKFSLILRITLSNVASILRKTWCVNLYLPRLDFCTVSTTFFLLKLVFKRSWELQVKNRKRDDLEDVKVMIPVFWIVLRGKW